jgi:DNA mismatch endonuclease (patch repair protein)
MSRIKSKNTAPEKHFRKFIWKMGIRGYRTNNKTIYGKPDLYFGKMRIAVFIDGCFWHMCPQCYKPPVSNKVFWREKHDKNTKRDQDVNRYLNNNGIQVVRFWEHEIKNDTEHCYNVLKNKLK